MRKKNIEEKIVETVKVEAFAKALNLEIVYRGRGEITLSNISVCRPGLQLTGFFNYFDSSRVQVIGNAEYEYLKNCTSGERTDKLRTLLSLNLPCLILARDLQPMKEILECCKEAECPLFCSPEVTSILDNDLVLYLNTLLAPTMTMHGVLLDVYGVGTLLTGGSGIGKSESALELIKHGHRLVADDAVILKQISNRLIGTSPEVIRYFMELRGVGIVDIRSMYGTGSVLNDKEVELIIELKKWEDGATYERLGENKLYDEYLGIKIPKLVIPVRPGRNLAIIIEVAARNYRLKNLGYDAAQELIMRSMGSHSGKRE